LEKNTWKNGVIADWMIGGITDFNEGKLTFGFIQNDEIVDCPTNSTQWREWFENSWDVNDQIEVKCDGK